MTPALPDFLRNMITVPPRAGEGVHMWLFRVARQLHAHLPSTAIISLLETRAATCGRHVSRAEIVAAVQNSITCAWQPSRSATSKPTHSKWPNVNQLQLEAVARTGGLADLWELSPIRIEDNEPHTEEIIDRLFPGNPLLCCGKSQSAFDTRPRDDWRGELAQLQFVVPSSMTAPRGLTKDGKESAHALSNTGPRRFLIVECDFAVFARDGKTETKLAPLIRKLNGDGIETADMGAAVLINLARYAPLVCAVHSGGKSLHGWFFVEGQHDEKVTKLFRYAVSLGADPATWTRSQFVRMPDGTRDRGKRQSVYFLNFRPLEIKR